MIEVLNKKLHFEIIFLDQFLFCFNFERLFICLFFFSNISIIEMTACNLLKVILSIVLKWHCLTIRRRSSFVTIHGDKKKCANHIPQISWFFFFFFFFFLRLPTLNFKIKLVFEIRYPMGHISFGSVDHQLLFFVTAHNFCLFYSVLLFIHSSCSWGGELG